MVNMPDSWMIAPLPRSQYKYVVIGYGPDGRPDVIVKFGDARYSDYTLHGDRKRMKAYVKRHAPREDWEDLTTSGAWARWILWSRSKIDDAIDDMEDRFQIRIHRAW